MRQIRCLAVLVITLCLTSCASTTQGGWRGQWTKGLTRIFLKQSIHQYRVLVSSLKADNLTADKKVYILLSATDDVKTLDLQFREFAAYIRRGLGRNGFREANEGEKPEIAIFLAYGIGDPEERDYNYVVPVHGQTGISSSRKIGNTIWHTPSYGVTGYVTRTVSSTTFTRYLLLSAVDLSVVSAYAVLLLKYGNGVVVSEENGTPELWRTQVVSSGSSGDLRRVFPVMVAASHENYGTDTKQQSEFLIREDDYRIDRIKGVGVDRDD